MPAPGLPPGRAGLPLLGETLAFARDGFGFIASRRAAHGPVFRTGLLGRRVAVLSGPDAVAAFMDPDNIVREGSMPRHIQALFGGRSLPLLDGGAHLARKTVVLEAFGPAALASYLPVLEAMVEDAAARWAGLGELRWIDELKLLALAAIGRTVGGITDRATLEALCRDYQLLTAAFLGLPIPLPGTRYTRAMAARERIFAVFRRQVAARRAAPGEDGLSRMLAARAADGTALDDDAAVLELHHAIVAGFIVFAEFAASAVALAQAPDVRRRVRREVREMPPGPLAPERLRALPCLARVVMETKRLCPIIPAVFGRARRDFSFAGRRIPEGWTVMWDVRGTHLDTAIYTDPERFDPDRYAPGREEHARHPHGFVPQGGGPPTGHRCAGVDLATVMMSVFLVVLLRGYSWRLPPQDLEYDWRFTPPEPKDGLRAVVEERGA